METLCSRVSAYLYMGASVQMAYSLGLHRDQLAETGTSLEREQNRRIWWTLFFLDQELASRGGSPNIIDERYTKVTTPMSSEQVCTIDPRSSYFGRYSPRSDTESRSTYASGVASYLRVTLSTKARNHSSCLHRTVRNASVQYLWEQALTWYIVSSSANSISFSTISNSLLLLQKWYRQIPCHLKHDIPTPPTHKRAVAVLHLHYWGTTILLTRPFLLYLVIKHNTLASNKKIWFERMGRICIDAAQKSVAILQHMAADGMLSSLTASDSTCVLRLIMVFVLAYTHTRTSQYSNHIETCIRLSKGMEQIGFTKMVAEETPGRLADLGISEKPHAGNGNGRDDVHLDDQMIAQLWGRHWDP
jgi:hypothetical protein